MKDITRRAGILMPVSALPSNEGIGTLGEWAYKFVDFLADSGHTVWQVLPLSPTGYGDSPYQSCSSNALNYYFIDLSVLISEGLLAPSDVEGVLLYRTKDRVDYELQFTNKLALLRRAFANFTSDASFEEFCDRGEYADFALFMAAKEHNGYAPFYMWEDMRVYSEDEADKFHAEHIDDIRFWQWTQYEFLRQWRPLKEYANSRGVAIMGDIPLYVAYDSAEVWKEGDKLFKMDAARRPSCVAGVPPDAFTEDGQLWGNPVYDWDKMKKDGYKWWNRRISSAFGLFDILRIDHFRGFDRYYEVPFGDSTAKRGQWADGPKEDFFKDKLSLNIVAEDLGVIDYGVRRLMRYVGYPGMKVLSFAFDGDANNEYKPEFYGENCVCYTGTHDNMPLKQFYDSLSDEQFERVGREVSRQCKLLGVRGRTDSPRALTDRTVALAYMSKAGLSIAPYWDILALGEEARFNFPSTVSPLNWSFRFSKKDFGYDEKRRLKALVDRSAR